jgi:hypothetical protein
MSSFQCIGDALPSPGGFDCTQNRCRWLIMLQFGVPNLCLAGEQLAIFIEPVFSRWSAID